MNYAALTRPRRRRAAPTPFELIDRTEITRPPPPPAATGATEEIAMPETAAEADEIIARDPQIVARTIAEARAVYAKVSRAEGFPVHTADHELQALRRALANKTAAEQLLIALKLLDRAEFWASSDPRSWPAIAGGHEAARVASQPAITAPSFNSAPFLGALAMRGVTLAVVGGGIVARPAGLLNATDRAMLTQHRNAIIEALLRTEEF